jgi:glycerophosphoryl diester phosphodiesterase
VLDFDRKRSKVFVQSFETGNLKALDRDVPLVQLFAVKGARPFDFVASGDPRTYFDLATPAGPREVARYADGVGPSKDYIVRRDASGASLEATSFVEDAHHAGLLVHPYTFRNYGNAIAEYEQFYGLGVDGLFADNPDTAVEAR